MFNVKERSKQKGEQTRARVQRKEQGASRKVNKHALGFKERSKLAER